MNSVRLTISPRETNPAATAVIMPPNHTHDSPPSPSREAQQTDRLRPRPIARPPATPGAPRGRSHLRDLLHATGVGSSSTFISHDPFSAARPRGPRDSSRRTLPLGHNSDASIFSSTSTSEFDPESDSQYRFSESFLEEFEAELDAAEEQVRRPAISITSLPTRRLTPDDEGENHTGATCHICLLDVAVGTTVTYLGCLHWFCTECLDPWLLGGKSTCPTCREPIA